MKQKEFFNFRVSFNLYDVHPEDAAHQQIVTKELNIVLDNLLRKVVLDNYHIHISEIVNEELFIYFSLEADLKSALSHRRQRELFQEEMIIKLSKEIKSRLPYVYFIGVNTPSI